MSVHQSPSIPTDSLVFYVDAANPKSYPGFGTTWYDLSQSGFDVELSNDPTHSNGVFSFDGVDQYGTVASGLKDVIDASTGFTVVALANVKYIQHIDNLIGWGNANEVKTWGIYSQSGTLKTAYITGASFGSNATITNHWLLFVSRYDSTTTYANTFGAVENVSTAAYDISNWTTIPHAWPITICKTNYYSRYMEADVASICCYNRKLSDAELDQTFNAVRGRYEI